MLRKPSFFSKLAGTDNDNFDDAPFSPSGTPSVFNPEERDTRVAGKREGWQDESEEDTGELAVDVYQTPDVIVVKAFIAGVQPNTVDISLTRESVTVSGTRTEDNETSDENYYQRELYWGSFSRTILLPEEVDVDLAEASEKHGVLVLRLPKVNKAKQTKLKVRSR